MHVITYPVVLIGITWPIIIKSPTEIRTFIRWEAGERSFCAYVINFQFSAGNRTGRKPR